MFRVIWALVFAGALTSWIGMGYRGLRFAANYEVTTAKISRCTSEFHSDGTGRYHVFEIYVEGLDYPILEISPARGVDFKLSEIFKEPPPEFDWCTMKGKEVIVYHYDKISAATVFREPPDDLGTLGLIWSLESGAGTLGLVLIAILTLLALAGGAWFLKTQIVAALRSSGLPERRDAGPVLYSFRVFNAFVAPVVLILFTSLLTVFLGLSLPKGMLYIENRFNFVTGLFFLVGVALATFGPGLIVKSVHVLRSSKNDVLIATRNLLLLGGLGRLAYNAFAFVSNPKFSEVGDEGRGSFVLEILFALIS